MQMARDLIVSINSPGGYVNEGSEIYTALKKLSWSCGSSNCWFSGERNDHLSQRSLIKYEYLQQLKL